MDHTSTKLSFKMIAFITLAVTLAIWGLLGWNYLHGGIPKHHLLARNDLPAFSNAWGGLVIPLISFFLLFRIKTRIDNNPGENSNGVGNLISSIRRFCFALFFGILMSTFFALGYANYCGYMIDLLFILGLFFPVYFSEYLLGFIWGMTFSFGAVLPTLIGSVLAIIGLVLYKLVRPLLVRLISNILKKRKSSLDQ